MRKIQSPALKSTGFTIVEVLFVLAIAGLILLLVFQAIPALQRSSHNNQRKQDVSTILRAVSQYELKDSGNFPADCPTGPKDCTYQLGSTNDYFLFSSKDSLNLYQPTDISLKGQTTAAGQPNTRAPQSGPNNADKVQIYNYEKCSAVTNGAAVIAGAGYDSVVALYDLESGQGSPTPQCQQL
jgi:type II secretory pathway pseudopilin PulG